MECPRLSGLQIISRKWSYFILRSLREPMHFSDIKRELHFVTNHVLARELKQLREEKVIVLEGDLYKITVAGNALLAAAEPLYHWGVEHRQLPHCPIEQECSRCSRYPGVVGQQFAGKTTQSSPLLNVHPSGRKPA